MARAVKYAFDFGPVCEQNQVQICGELYQLRRLRHRACHGLLDIDVAAGLRGCARPDRSARGFGVSIATRSGRPSAKSDPSPCIPRRTRNASRCLVLGQVRCRTRLRPPRPASESRRREPESSSGATYPHPTTASLIKSLICSVLLWCCLEHPDVFEIAWISRSRLRRVHVRGEFGFRYARAQASSADVHLHSPTGVVEN